MGARAARAPALQDVRHRARRRRDHRSPAADVEQRRRDLALPPVRGRWTTSSATARATRSSSSTRARARSRRSSATCRTRTGDYVVIPRGTTYRFEPEGAAALPRLRDAGPDRDPAPLPQPVRAAARGRAVLPPRHPSADRAAHGARARRVPGQGARPRRLPDVRRRLPPVRRRRLGRLPLPVDVLDPRLRADHRPHPPAAAVAPDLPGPELRDLLVLPAQARLRPARGADPVPPLEPAVRGDDLLRLRQLRLAEGRRGRLDHAPSVRPAARPAARARGEVDRDARDARARRDVRHVPPAASCRRSRATSTTGRTGTPGTRTPRSRATSTTPPAPASPRTCSAAAAPSRSRSPSS